MVAASRRRDHEELLHGGHGAQGRLPQSFGRHRHDPPAQHREVLLDRQGLDDLLGLGGVVVLAGQEGQADGVGAGVGEGESGRLGCADQEPVRHLDQNAGAVAGGDLGARRTTVGQPLEDGQPLVDDVVVGTAVEVGHHAHAAGVVLIRGVVKADGHRVASFRIRVGN